MRTLLMALMMTTAPLAHAGQADVLDVRAIASGDGSYRFEVTVSHGDEGWEHYADRWEVIAADGTLLATRTLFHPHVHEQPFTRSLSGVSIPAGVREVTIRAHDSVHNYGGRTVTLILPR